MPSALMDQFTALGAARRAASGSEGYRTLLAERGLDPDRAAFEELPYLDKDLVFGGGDAFRWLIAGDVNDIAEIVSSSGHSGVHSLGVMSRAEVDAAREGFDRLFGEIGVRRGRPALFVNCLAMGVSVPTSLATIATPTVHMEMALEFVLRHARRFDRLVLAGEPIFVKELFERASEIAGPSWAPRDLVVFVGGEWVAEGLRRHLCRLAGLDYGAVADDAGILISMGAAEVGLHALFETPALRSARRALQDPARRVGVFAAEHAYAPSLFTFDAQRFHFEERDHPDGSRTLVCTTLGDRLLPLIRYDLADLGELVDPRRLRDALAGTGASPGPGPIVAVWGRRRAAPHSPLRAEIVKEAIFALPDVASALTARFRIHEQTQKVHFQLREGASHRSVQHRLRALLDGAPGGPWEVAVHSYDSFPFHAAGDYQRKPTYHDRDAAGVPEEALR